MRPKEGLAPLISLSETWTTHEGRPVVRWERHTQEREEIMSTKQVVSSNEVGAGLLATSVNSVGAGK